MSDHVPGNGGAAVGAASGDEEAKRNERKRKRWSVVLVLALVVFVGSLVALGVIAFSYFQGQQKYDHVAQTADADMSDVGDDAELGTLKVDWDALKAANSDTVGWVYMPNTPINYPVVQGQDNDHYLYYDFDGDAGWLAEYGAIFMDYRNKRDFTDSASFIYGHHMNDGSMFAVISSFEDQANFDAHRIAYVLTPQGNYRVRSFSIVHCAADDPMVETSFANKKAMTKYVQDKIDRSLVNPGDIPKADEIDKVFALVTCDSYSGGRDVLFMYVLDTTAAGLEGELGLDSNKESTWFVEELETKE